MKLNQKGFLGKIIVFIIVGGCIYVYYNLSKSVLGEIIYPLKNIQENLILSQYEFNYSGKAERVIEFSQIKLGEVRKLVDNNADSDKIIDTLEQLKLMQDKAITYLDQAKSNAQSTSKVIEKLVSVLKDQSNELDKMTYEVNPDIHQTIIDAKDYTDENLKKLNP